MKRSDAVVIDACAEVDKVLYTQVLSVVLVLIRHDHSLQLVFDVLEQDLEVLHEGQIGGWWPTAHTAIVRAIGKLLFDDIWYNILHHVLQRIVLLHVKLIFLHLLIAFGVYRGRVTLQ